MAKNTETAADVQGLVARKDFTFNEFKEAFKDIVEFEYNDAMEWAQDKLSCDITYFDKDELKDEVEYHLEWMANWRTLYDHFDAINEEDTENAIVELSDFWDACRELNKYLIEHDIKTLKAFNERYSGIVDADVLEVISNFVKF